MTDGPAGLAGDRRPELAREAFPVRRVRRRVDQLASELELELDRERMRRWAVVHALACGLGADEWFPDIVACAVRLAEA